MEETQKNSVLRLQKEHLVEASEREVEMVGRNRGGETQFGKRDQ